MTTVYLIQQFQMEEINKQKEESKKLGWNLMTHFLKENCNLFSNLIVRVLMKQKLMRWKKFAENSKQRYYKIKQWCQTEATYLKKLLILRDQVRKPLLDNNLITQLDSVTIFSNLDAMIKLSQLINLELKTIFANWNPIKTQLSPVLNPLINCLKIYKDYSERYEKSFAFMVEVVNKPSFKTYVKVTNLDDLLFSPVQRFMKHHLFVSEYFRKLPQYHKDKENLNRAMDSLLRATQQINQFMQSQIKAKKLIELQKKFGDIASPSRRYKTQFHVKCWEINELICKVYLFNNFLLVVRVINQHKEQLIQRITLSQFSVIVKQPNCKSFQNRLYLCGLESSIHLNFDYPQYSDQMFVKINRCIQKLYKNQSKREDLILQNKRRGSAPTSSPMIQNKISVYHSIYNPLDLSVQVMCMQKLFLGQEQKKLFVIKVSSAKPFEVSQYLFYDLKKLSELQNLILQICPYLKVPSNYMKEKKNRNDFKIQDLSTAIQKFCNFILRNRTLSKNHNFAQILSKIGLHKIMQIFARSNRSGAICLCPECSNVKQYTNFNYYYQHKYRFSKYCVVNSFQTINTIASSVSKREFKNLKIQQIMLWAKCKLKRIDYTLLEEDIIKTSITQEQRQKIDLVVQVRYASEKIKLKTKKTIRYSTVRQVISQLAQNLKLKNTSDLALMFVYGEYQTILDDDQYIYEYAKFLIDQDMQNNDVFFSLRDIFLQKIRLSKPKENKIKGQLILRKLYMFNTTLEQVSFLNDSNRVRLISGQIFYKYKVKNFQLNDQESIAFCSLFYYVTTYKIISQIKKGMKIAPQLIKEFLPCSNWNKINEQFMTKIEKQVSKMIGREEPIQEAQKKILRKFGNKTHSITEYFQIEDNKKNPHLGLGNIGKLLIGVSYKKIIITRQRSKIPLLSYRISSFKYRIYGETIYIETDRKTYQLTCKNIFMLDTMIKIYKLLEQSKD